MNDILKDLATAFQLVSSIPVTDDAIDKMAIVRSKLRKVYAELEKMESEQKPDQTE